MSDLEEKDAKRNVPKLRFPGFTDPWEQRKLGEVARRVTRKNTGNESDLPLTISAQNGLVDQRTFFNKQVASKDMSGYYLLHKGEFAYNKSTSNGNPWGAVKRLEMYEKGCVSTLYICFEPFDADSDWLCVYYETDYWHKEVRAIATEGARNHGLLNVSPDDFLQTRLLVPSSTAEQRAIGAFFADVDNLITLRQCELEHTKELKRGLLQKMFPKEGSDAPEIRFPGFTDPWEQRKLGELFSESDERSSDMEILSVSVSKGVYPASESDRDTNPGASISKYKIVNRGDVVYNSMRLWQGAIDASLYDGIVSPAYLVAKPQEGTVSRFFSQLLRRTGMLFKYRRFSQGNSKDTLTLKYDDFAKIIVAVPSAIAEQEEIATYFDQLDNLITLRQRELDHVKLLKKALLQQMFV